MVDQFTVCQSRSSARRQPQRAVVDCSDETTAQKHSGRRAPIEKMMLAERRHQLESHKPERKANPSTDRRGKIIPAS